MIGIQTRPIFTGNVLKQPAFSKINYKNLGKDYEVANYILKYEEIVEYSALLSLIMFVIIVAYIASLIMVWKLKALGRNLLLVTIIFSIIISFGYKYTFMDSLEEILFSVSLIIEGAILALIYLSPISKKFK